MVRLLVGLLLLLPLGGCELADLYDLIGLSPCDTACPFARDQSFGPGADYGLLVFGLTVKGPAPGKDDLGGHVDWLVETADSEPDLGEIYLPDGLKPGQHVVLVWRAEPGTWSLRQVRWQLGDQSGATPPYGGRALATEVTAGAVTYVGELTIDGSQVLLSGDEAGARAALLAYPGILLPPQSRPLRDLRSGRDGSGGRKGFPKPSDSGR